MKVWFLFSKKTTSVTLQSFDSIRFPTIKFDRIKRNTHFACISYHFKSRFNDNIAKIMTHISCTIVECGLFVIRPVECGVIKSDVSSWNKNKASIELYVLSV